VLTTVRAAGAKQIPAAIIFSSGFSEMGDAGRELEMQLLDVARQAGVRLCGPNCLGLINAFERVLVTFSQFADGATPPGPIGFVTQSGAFGTAIAALARQRSLGLGYFVNTGNEIDLDFVQVMRAVLADPRIKVGAGYIEGLKDGHGLVDLAVAALALGKPLVLTKVGRMGAGIKAAASHTGSLAGEDTVFDGVIRQHGIIRARNEEHMLDIIEVLNCCSLPEGNGLGLLTQSGGAGVLMADRAEEVGLSVPVLSKKTQDALQKVIPGFGATANPVDVTGQFVANPALLRDSAIITLADPEVHVGIIWLQLMEGHVDALVRTFEEIKAAVSKPFIVCWVAAPEAGLRALRERGIAVLRGGEPAIDAVSSLVAYAKAKRMWQEDAAARSAIQLPALEFPAAAGAVPTLKASYLLQQSGIPIAQVKLAQSADEAAALAEQLSYPVALKIESPDILHKTEAQGVRLNLKHAQAVKEAFQALAENARQYSSTARIDGVVVQKMATGDVEFVLGLQNDPVFGVVIMAGLGGVLVEVLKDVVFRKVPVTAREADGMLHELQGKAILAGVRGRPAIDRHRLIHLICAVSRFGAAAQDRLVELDLNPVLLGGDTAVAVDWLMILNDVRNVSGCTPGQGDTEVKPQSLHDKFLLNAHNPA
jgi:acetyltransferase